MPLPRPASPSALFADVRALFALRSPHQWLALALALLIPAFFLVAFAHETLKAGKPPEQLVYAKGWKADRTDAEIIADQKKAQAEKDALAKERQRQFQKLADTLGIDTKPRGK
jgi:hypothetical protein